MLTSDIERYLSLRQGLGFKLPHYTVNLRAFAAFAAARGETHVQSSTANDWASGAPTPGTRHIRLLIVVRFARFAHVEDARHEIPLILAPRIASTRPPPYIYTPEEIATLMAATKHLKKMSSGHRSMYAVFFGLIASTGLRISEALSLRITDILPGGILQVRRTKFGKARLLPLHASVVAVLESYLATRRQIASVHDQIFLNKRRKPLTSGVARYTFHRLLQITRIAANRGTPPRIHDLRHTFATRALERCSARHDEVGRHFVALSTYMGHVDVKSTYWYLQATPEMMTDIATAAEKLIEGRRS